MVKDSNLHEKLLKRNYLPYQHNLSADELIVECGKLAKDGYSCLKIKHKNNYSLYCKKK